MFETLSKLARSVGQIPGSLTYVGDQTGVHPAKITLTIYDEEHADFREISGLADIPGPSDDPGVRWIDVQGLSDTAPVSKCGELYALHPLILEDILHTTQRPKVEDMEDYLFVVLRALDYDNASHRIVERQTAFVLGRNYLISLREIEGKDLLTPVRERILAGKGRLRRLGPDYLLYALLDAIVDNYFLVLEKLGEDIELLESKLLASPDPSELQSIHVIKHEAVMFRKFVWPVREVVSRLETGGSKLIGDGLRIYLKDLYDHTIQAMDTLETLRDILGGMIDVYLSSLSLKLSQVMKVLTVISTIFIPMSFVAGVYGMNFKNMPELDWPYGYYMALGLMASIAATFVTYFKRKKWI